jgi:hypothetical protein
LREAAKAKVEGMLADIMSMPTRWSKVINVEGRNLWAGQIYTYSKQTALDLDSQISAAGPWNNPPGFGYGSFQERATIGYDKKTNEYIGIPYQGYNAGFFFGPTFWNHIHIRY